MDKLLNKAINAHYPDDVHRNVVYTVTKTLPSNPHGEIAEGTTFKLIKELASLFAKAAKKRPSWQFVSYPFSMDAGSVIPNIRASNFFVVDNGEILGAISYGSSRRGSDRFSLESPELKRGRTRGYETTTTNEARALALLMKAYHRKTPSERLNELAQNARTLYSNEFRPMRDAERLRSTTVQNRSVAFARRNWEAFVAEYPDLADHVELDAAVNAFRAELSSLESVPSSVTSVIVLKQSSGNWLIANGANSNKSTSLPESMVPDAIRSKVAVLSLLDSGTITPGVGARVSDDQFVVVNVAVPE